MSPLFAAICLILAIAAPVAVNGVTLQQAQASPDKYIHYDTAEFNIGMHCGISLVMCYAMLCIIWLTVMGVVYATGGKKMRRQES